MIKFKPILYKLPCDENTEVSDSYITTVQRNASHSVRVTREACKKSVRMLSRLKDEKI